MGTDKDGLAAIPNGSGVYVTDAPGVEIGGSAAGTFNIIAGNTNDGVFIATSSGSETTAGTVVASNFIGTNPADSTSIPNGTNGVTLLEAPGVTVGGTSAVARNFISANTGTGVAVIGSHSTGAVIVGNFIGTTFAGIGPLPNSMGVQVQDAPGVTIGGTNPNAFNVISGNTIEGISIAETTPGATSGTTILNNLIGTDVTGTTAVGNFYGIGLLSTTNVTVGGTTASARNIISGNGFTGIQVYGADSNGAQIIGNYIGTSVSGTGAVPNVTGITVQAGTTTTIGGTVAGATNVISGNSSDGILVGGSSPTATTIAGNLIGTRPDGTTALPNGDHGVSVQNSIGVTIGGTAAGARNVISGNALGGVALTGTSQAAILGNSIFGNDGLGIDLGTAGVTPNDTGDGDSGPNNLQNFPVIQSAATQNGTSRVTAMLNSQASQTLSVGPLSSPASPGCDASGYGEAKVFLGRFPVVTDGSGNGSVTATVPTLTIGDIVTATATSAGGSTSEFSLCKTVAMAPITATPSGGVTSTVEGGTTDTITLEMPGAPSANVMIALASNAPGLASFATSSTVTFTPADWSTPQVVTVTSVDDQVYYGASYTIGFTVTSADTLYNGLSVPALAATHTENDPPPSLAIADSSGSEPASAPARSPSP